ncbi:MAG TPA: hypothetical protein VF719_11665, partial [Abditibacteriaceae bacterium]
MSCVGAHTANAQAEPVSKNGAKFKEGELLVKFAPGASPSLRSIRDNIASVRSKAAPINRKAGAEEIRTLGFIGWQHVRLRNGMTIDEAVAWYKR